MAYVTGIYCLITNYLLNVTIESNADYYFLGAVGELDESSFGLA